MFQKHIQKITSGHQGLYHPPPKKNVKRATKRRVVSRSSAFDLPRKRPDEMVMSLVDKKNLGGWGGKIGGKMYMYCILYTVCKYISGQITI